MPTSRRQYLSQTELSEFANITITDQEEADDRISQCEEMIDAYVGPQEKFMRLIHHGVATSASNNTLVDTSDDSPLRDMHDDYFTFCAIEIIGGTGVGQIRTITASEEDAMRVTVNENWDTNPTSSSAYKIWQLGKFPRCKDVWYDTDGQKYYKSIPEMVRRATAAQVDFLIAQGDAFFSGDKPGYTRERIGDYEYETGSTTGGVSSSTRLIAPRAKTFLKGIMTRTGRMLY